jgi:hypothetical protein
MNRPFVLSLCDYTGNMVEPWVEAGYECWIVDTKHAEGIHESRDGIVRVGWDVRTFLPPLRPYAAVFAFPPCTHLAVSGARWFKEKGIGKLVESLDIVEHCRRICEWSGAPWMLENPVSTISSYWRKPDHIFNPCEYGGYLQPPGDPYTKRTCLWVGGGFVIPEPRPVLPTEGSKIRQMPDSKGREERRSETPKGFARAVFESNAQGAGIAEE